MTSANETIEDDPDRELMILGVMKATGLSREAVEGLYPSDEELDELCDSVLSEIAKPPKKASRGPAEEGVSRWRKRDRGE